MGGLSELMDSGVPQPSQKDRKLSRSTLKIVNIYYQSIVKHRYSFGVLTDSVRPDIILGTETWLDPSVTAPTELAAYKVERLDRNRHGGGVFVAVKDNIIMSRESDLEVSDSELLRCKINLASYKTPHVVFQYHPNVADNTRLSLLCQSLQMIARTHSVILGGKSIFLTGTGQYQVSNLVVTMWHHRRPMDIMEDKGFRQHCTCPTRGDNTLNLLLINRPNSAIQSQVIPGISDHDHDEPLVNSKVEFRPLVCVKKPRDIPHFMSASWDKLRYFNTS